MKKRITAGRAFPLGASFDGEGVNFAVFSENARRMTLCLFDENGKNETRVNLPERDGDVWHGFMPGLKPGQLYGYRAIGPYRPDQGHRFNHHKLLLDPYARQLTGHPNWSERMMGYSIGAPSQDLSYDRRDSAQDMPKCVVQPDLEPLTGQPLMTPLEDTVIYEAHVKGMTAKMPGIDAPGSFSALANSRVLDHLHSLGVTAIELLPVQAFLNDHWLLEKGLTNYWGYQSIGFFAPDPRYLHFGQIAEFRDMVGRFHSAGIEVLLDVVYNHTGEGNQLGPTLSFRGLDNRAYYKLLDSDPRYYINDTGTGNTINIEHPMVLRMVMDSLRYWVEIMGVDGFRFDLCSVLGRAQFGFDPGAAFFDAIRQDPVLGRVKLIAEPWDIGPGGYQLGAYPAPFSEWNDKFRDGVRRFWRKDPGRVPDLADRLTGSATQFDHSGRPATSSVNFITAHDGFTLADTVSFGDRHNLANGENGNDGHSENFSDNMGAEGATDCVEVLALRAARRRAMMATMLLAQGTPMILAGDELGNSQTGNNNAYCQDNSISWIDWDAVDESFLRFTKRMIALRRAHPVLRQKRFLHSRERITDGKEDLFWWREDGQEMLDENWEEIDRDHLIMEIRTASGTPRYAARDDALFVVFNAGSALDVMLPNHGSGTIWTLEIDTSAPDADSQVLTTKSLHVAANSVVACSFSPED